MHGSRPPKAHLSPTRSWFLENPERAKQNETIRQTTPQEQPNVGRSQIFVGASWLSPLQDDRLRAVVSRLLNKHGAERVPALKQHVHRQQLDEDLREALQIFIMLLKSGSEATGRLPEYGRP
jgi:hypothetical protein